MKPHMIALSLRIAFGHIFHGWCQGAYARDQQGHVVAPESPDATRFSIDGALWASGLTGLAWVDVRAALRRELPAPHQHLQVFNDHPDTHQSDVDALFTRAIERLP